MYTGLQHISYTIGRLTGKGGEGEVYEVNENPNLLAKLYNEPLTSEKVKKLTLMVALQKTTISQIAAWPSDVIAENGTPVGLVMRKLTGFVPLHMLFSPMDRKKLFPDKGYNFLVHVARNLATAFHRLHEEGIIAGDINEGNILVNAQGMVAFIDCDSFQVKNGDHYYYCEVGVPRYTPPELLTRRSFGNIARTINTDVFSMAILIFQLLFLGRHPFTGINKTTEEWDEERAIREHQFAWSLLNLNKKLQPPVNSLNITILNTGVTDLFHKAFEHDINRPTAEAWIQELDQLSKTMVTCPKSTVHSYPNTAPQCPWCYFKEQKGILFFLDNTTAGPTLMGDIHQFINGYQPEKLQLNTLSATYPSAHPGGVSIDPQWYKYRTQHLISITIALLLTPLLFFLPNLTLAIITWPATLVLFYKVSPWRKRLLAEKERLFVQFQTGLRKLEDLVKLHNHPPTAANYHKAALQLQNEIEGFRRLPILFQERKKALEEELYNKQLLFFLCAFEIKDHTIPGFGPAKKQLLYSKNIRNAADISLLHSIKVNGIGPKNIHLLLSWQRQMSADFTYRPNFDQINKETQQLADTMEKEKQQLANTIRQQYQQLQQIKAGIFSKQKTLELQYQRLGGQVALAELQYTAFQQLI